MENERGDKKKKVSKIPACWIILATSQTHILFMSKQTTHIHRLIADYLKENNYLDTLRQFENEHGNPIPATKLLDESLSDIINDRIQYNTLLGDNKANEGVINVNDELSSELKQIITQQFSNWITPFPRQPSKLIDIDGLVISSCHDKDNELIYLSSNDCKVYVVKQNNIVHVLKTPVVIKKILVIDDSDKVVLVGMNGILYLREKGKLQEIDQFQAHKRLIVDAKSIVFRNQKYLITLGWDFHLRLIMLHSNRGDKNEVQRFELWSELKLQQQGSCLDVTVYQDQLVIVLGKTENTLLDVITMSANNSQELTLVHKISLNDAEFTAAGFSPRCLTIENSGHVPLIAVGTSHEPYMRLIIVPLRDLSHEPSIKRNQIIKNLNTMSPQDRYSQPIIAWRVQTPDNNKASGVWVMGDDGTIRGIDIVEDQVIVELKDGHQGKIKDFITFIDENSVEKLVTSGIDREIITWK
ncbi:conserved hypothetical protein [Candida dubliniensis CD36]|uniref:Uncharacterized protein n=1 Tax=Candida dubliniensis (strain CD36 / ATCC MYA-646 / CBS 7987 / NCPF 3949 / NRRL Y-17841) TaxID=573826 RepID=B9W855_CANDC|nr:conserved hypothetical protein [Candida dubliniensis CD36]CAX44894.1 conserved hypothetical protein [Candida dubliniensis CD36]